MAADYEIRHSYPHANVKPPLEVIKVGTSATITVRVFTKNTEDTGDGVDADNVTIARNTSGRSVAEWAGSGTKGAKQMERYKFTASGTAGDWTLFRMLAPIWFDSVPA